MTTKRIQLGHEELRIRGKTKGDCAIHDWPTPGLGARLVQAMRDRHPKGIDACPPCIERAVQDVRSGCCVCGRTELPHPDESTSRALGLTLPKPEPVTWRCQACKRKVCRDHVQTFINDHGAREIGERTLCTDPKCIAERDKDPP